MNHALHEFRNRLQETFPAWLVTAFLGPLSRRAPGLSFVAYWALWGLFVRLTIDPWFSPAAVTASATTGLVVGVVLLLCGLCGFPNRE